MPITERTARIKKRLRMKHVAGGEYVDPAVRAGVERARLITEAHKETAGLPMPIRRAKMLENYLLKSTIVIQEDELIVGFNAENPNYFPLYPELSYYATMDIVDSPYVEDDVREEVKEIAEYWRPRGLQARCEQYFTEEELERLYCGAVIEVPLFVSAYSSGTPTYECVLQDGLDARIQKIQQKIDDAKAQLNQFPWNAQDNLPLLKKIDNWRAMKIAAEAVVTWARRHSRLARILAEHFETDPKRREELLRISDICWRVPAEPCKGFHDAMQAKWFVYLVCHAFERYASGFSHKEDSLLWPYYKASVIDKTFQPMTREDAQELVECERLKISEHGNPKSRGIREVLPGANDLFILTVGGVNRDGSDGCTEMTDVILDAAESIVTTEPSIGFRWNKIGRIETKRRVFNCIRKGLGYPSIKNDELNINQLVTKFGVPLEEARNWALVLCMSPGVSGRRATQKTRTEGGSEVRLIKCLELALFNGFDYSFTGIQVGPKTGEASEFKTFDDVWEAFRAQVRNALQMAYKAKDIARQMKIEIMPIPFWSAIDDECVEKGVDALELTTYPNPWHNSIGNICCVNSLAAIKKLIFDEKKYTMEQLITALKANWEGYEQMRQDFLKAPKWGNDDPYVDEIAKKYYDFIAEEWGRIKMFSGASPMPLGQSVATYAYMGPRVGATPDGRRQGEVIDDGGISPYPGTDKKGPTAVLKSVSKIDPTKHKGNLLNQRLSHLAMRSDKGFDLWLSYMNTWHELGIDHVQFNVVSTEEMRAAQKEPEKHQDLIVRVAGYSARFIDITKYQQDAIIARTEQQLG